MRDTMLGGFLAMEREHDRLIAAGAPLNFEPGDMESEYLWNAFASPPGASLKPSKCWHYSPVFERECPSSATAGLARIGEAMRMLKRGSPDAARATRALAPLAIVEGAGVTARAIAALGRFAGPMAPGE